MVLTVPTNYPTIQSAINAASAGDTVQVLAGNYTEQLFLTKSITLVGSGAASTFISQPKTIVRDSSGNYWPVNVLDGSTVSISGFTFPAPLQADPKCVGPSPPAVPCGTIGVQGGSTLNLTSSVVEYTSMSNGLFIAGNPNSIAHAVVTNVTFELPSAVIASPYTYDGIYVVYGTAQVSDSTIVSQPTLGGDSDGIFLDAGSTVSFSHNVISGGVPIAARYDSGPNIITAEIISNTLRPTGLSHFGGTPSAALGTIIIAPGSDFNITGNTIMGGTNVLSGINIAANNDPYSPTTASIVNNTISDILCTNLDDRPAGICGPDAFSQDQLPGILVSPPSFQTASVHFQPGFASSGTPEDVHNAISITGNHISETDSGIQLTGVQNCCEVSDNVISNSTDYGIAAANGNFAFPNNSISGGAYGATAIAGLANATVTLPGSEIQGTTISSLYPQSQSPYVARIALNETGLTSTTTTTSVAATTTTVVTTTTTSTPVTATTATLTSSSVHSMTATTSSTTSSATTPSTTGGGIPEFPFQLLATSILVVLVGVSYLAVRRCTGKTI